MMKFIGSYKIRNKLNPIIFNIIQYLFIIQQTKLIEIIQSLLWKEIIIVIEFCKMHYIIENKKYDL